MGDVSAVVLESLEAAEEARMVRLERTIERALKVAVEVAGKISGEALATIRDERLYRATHSTFEAYVTERWKLSRAHAYRMIDVATHEKPVITPERYVPGQDGMERVSSRDKGSTSSRGSAPGRPDSPFVIPDPASDDPLMPLDAGRLWGLVGDADDGWLRIDVDLLGATEFPPLGTKVLVAWER